MPGPRCTVCSHEERATIDKVIAGGENSIRDIARQYGLSKDAIRRHGESHIVKAVQRAMRRRKERDEDQVADTFEARLAVAHAATRRALTRAEQDPNALRFIAPLVGQLHRNAELLGRAEGQFADQRGQGGGDLNVQFVLVLPRCEPKPKPAIADVIEVNASGESAE